jgi:hypothetical protein
MFWPPTLSFGGNGPPFESTFRSPPRGFGSGFPIKAAKNILDVQTGLLYKPVGVDALLWRDT